MTLIGSSTSTGPNESYVLPAPEPLNDLDANGNCVRCYALQVINVANAPGTTSTSFTAQAGLAQPGSGTGGFAVTPASTQATAGVPIRLRASWSGLDDETPYVGWIEYPNGERDGRQRQLTRPRAPTDFCTAIHTRCGFRSKSLTHRVR